MAVMRYLIAVLATLGAAVLWLGALAVIVRTFQWAAQRRDDGDHLATNAPAPEAVPPRVPGPYPGEGPPAGPPNPNAGGPSPGLEPRLLMSSRFYSDGVVYVDDHIKRTTRRFDPPPGDDLEVSDAEIERWLNDARD